MKLSSFVIMLTASLALADTIKDDASKKHFKQLEGAWKVVSIKSRDEGEAPQEMVRHMTILIEGDKFTTLFGDDQATEETFKLDTTKSPKAIDLTRRPFQGFITDRKDQNPPPVKRETLPGIYALDGDQLKICLGEAGKERPTEFPSKLQSGLVVLLLERDKSTSTTAKIKEIKIIGEINRAGGNAFHGEGGASDQLYVSLGQGKGDKEFERIAPLLKQFSSITGLHLHESKVTDAALAHLKGINNIHHINLSKTAITDAGLDHLEGMTKLRLLIVNGTQVTASGIVELKKALPKLQIEKLTPVQEKANDAINRAGGILFTNGGKTVRVDFKGEALTDAKLGELKEHLEVWKTSLKELNFSRSKLTDEGLEHLKGLTSLKRLKLTRANVTAEGVNALERSLPGLKIER